MVVAVTNRDHQTTRGNVTSAPPHMTAGYAPGAGNDGNEIDEETDEDDEDSEEAEDTSADDPVRVWFLLLTPH